MDFQAALAAQIDGKAKPPGALGRIEALAAQIATVQGSLAPRMEQCGLLILAGDHGLAAEGVSAYPAAVTRQMVLNFLAGGAAANVFAATLGAEVRVVDCGILGEPLPDARLILRRLGPGTRNSRHEPAMSAALCAAGLAAGEALGREGGHDALCLGEMGIGNSSAAALLAHKLTGLPLAALTGRGTGLDDAGLARKLAVLQAAAARTGYPIGGRLPVREALAEYAGFEMVTMAGAMIGAAAARRVVLVDGFIATAAALAALEVAPGIRPHLVFAHRSAEAGHAALLDALGAVPLLDLGLRLGEGTGALLAWPLLRAAAAMLNDMASLAGAGVSGPA
ncbi:MAG TPA: nicotinate-nucleotide--dimethylbenzimidazole phosphoribosyltransferase [Roseococcus sp.]|nr:nicotinate-nucleotide--dimethylbenzimidazole phosphoribosyltransferase [Roseococcus sp.]